MKNFIKLEDLTNFNKTLSQAIDLKQNITKYSSLGKGKTLGMLFFNYL